MLKCLYDQKESLRDSLPIALKRSDNFMQQEIFHKIHSETMMLRYLKRLENKDVSLCESMIPLGSCTMKLNSTTSMLPLTWRQ